MSELGEVFRRAVAHGIAYREEVAQAAVGRPVDLAALRAAFGAELNRESIDPVKVVDELVAAAGPGLVATTGPRFFGFVTGGALPAASAADMLAAAWDQNAFNPLLAPAAIAAEHAAGGWLKQLLGIPATASVGFVSGGQEANTVGLAAARHHILAKLDWDVERGGLMGAPRVPVLASVERHATIDRSLRLLGMGTSTMVRVAAEANGAIDIRALSRALPDGPAIVCLQSGNVNTGACDNLRAACDLVHERGGWVHVDGAFGLWAAASPQLRPLVDGIELADSWACDGHKWLNVPYDSGYAICAHPEVQTAAVSYSAAYLVGSTGEAADLTLQSSRRARGFATWAALRQLGSDGMAQVVERCCALARRFADGLREAGIEIVNDVVLNQVLVSFGDDERTDRVIAAVQRDGTCWMGGTVWRDRRLMRISVSNATTGESDVDASVAAIVRLNAAV